MNIKEAIAKTKPLRTIEEHSKDLINKLEKLYYLGYIDKDIFSLVKIACINHDLGKANLKFQERIKSNGRKKFNVQEEVPHNILSAYFLKRTEGMDDDDYGVLIHAIINHHNYVDVMEYLQDDDYKELVKEELRNLGLECDVDDVVYDIAEDIETRKAILVKGFLHKCDYSASASLEVEYKNNFLSIALEKFMGDLKEKNSSAHWNDMQEYCLNNKDENIIVVAQTGMGKTEGALLWINNNKGYFVLPLRTAINSIYKRIYNNILKSDSIEGIKEKVSILHSSSLEYYLCESKGNVSFDEIEKYEKEGKQWSIPLNITTMDQLFDFVFKYQGYEFKLATLSYSKIVIDEIQMYDPVLLSYLIYGLKLIYELGGKIAIVTATLPPFIYDLLCNEIPFKEKKEFYDESIIRHNVKVIESGISVEDIIRKYESNIEENRSNKILVICNTVKKAQEIFSELESSMKDNKNVHILHSRFTRMDRRKLEKEIESFGKTEVVGNGVWVATSIVEASLDIDFDYLFTELQDINSLFQRFGRCNRKGLKDSSYANCFVYTEVDQRLLKRKSTGFIDETMYTCSKEALKGIDGLIDEGKKIELINKYFTSEALKNSDYLKEYRDSINEIKCLYPYKFEKRNIRLREIYTIDIIPSDVYNENYEEIDSIEEKLADRTLEKGDRVKLKEELMKFTVSIPAYEYDRYEEAIRKGTANRYSSIVLDKFTKINIMDCNYDRKGFYAKGYKIQTGEGEFL